MSNGAARPTEFPSEWRETETGGDTNWRLETSLVDVPLDEAEAIWLNRAVGTHCPAATLESVTRIQNRGMFMNYRRCRDDEVRLTSAGGRTNENFLFHGTGKLSAQEVLKHLQAGAMPYVASCYTCNWPAAVLNIPPPPERATGVCGVAMP